MWIDVLTAAYAAFGVIGALAFLPQLLVLYKDKTRSENISLSTWLMWSSQAIVFFLYALIVVQKTTMVLVTLSIAILCTACTLMLLYNRFGRDWWYAKKGWVPEPVVHAAEMVAAPVVHAAEAVVAPVAEPAIAVAETVADNGWVENAWDAVPPPVQAAAMEEPLPTEVADILDEATPPTSEKY